MKVTFEKEDIEQMVREHLTKNGMGLSGKTLEISMVAGRGDIAGRLTVDIQPMIQKTLPIDDDLFGDKGEEHA